MKKEFVINCRHSFHFDIGGCTRASTKNCNHCLLIKINNLWGIRLSIAIFKKIIIQNSPLIVSLNCFALLSFVCFCIRIATKWRRGWWVKNAKTNTVLRLLNWYIVFSFLRRSLLRSHASNNDNNNSDNDYICESFLAHTCFMIKIPGWIAPLSAFITIWL